MCIFTIFMLNFLVFHYYAPSHTLAPKENIYHLTILSLIERIKSNLSSFKSNENIHNKEDESYYVVSAYKASAVTL